MSGIPMHRGLGPHVRGESDRIRGLGTLGAPDTFGHGGVGSSYSWADPASGVSFTYLTNYVYPDPWIACQIWSTRRSISWLGWRASGPSARRAASPPRLRTR